MNLSELIERVQGKAPKGAKRSRTWRKTRKRHLELHPQCAVCKSKKRIEVHHVIPFHIAPDKEESPDNLMTLCENKKYGINCHLLIGHVGNYRRFNPTCEMDAVTWRWKVVDSR